MNNKVKKGFFWGGIIASIVLVMDLITYLFGGINALAAGPHGHFERGMGPNGNFQPHHMIAQHYHNGFSWIGFLVFIILGITILLLVWKWIRKKSKATAMQQFIDTSLLSSHRTIPNQNANILDQWEKNIIDKKENI